LYQAIAISHVRVASIIAEPGKTSPPYSTAASTGKLRDNCGVRDDYDKKLGFFLVEWKVFWKRGRIVSFFLNYSLIPSDVFLTV
jgi:hypothetical protein